eukprot:TRINITY_DN6381_c0_g1_i1.p3 TRINITY_DN6381_c0_g1~~TRINITY_DN6381_c0_g1_i1.p3  ORF type:complete len:239 (-),score=39.45 TRINITY_DN6381_c0_g1_i1:874-1590(-)
MEASPVPVSPRANATATTTIPQQQHDDNDDHQRSASVAPVDSVSRETTPVAVAETLAPTSPRVPAAEPPLITTTFVNNPTLTLHASPRGRSASVITTPTATMSATSIFTRSASTVTERPRSAPGTTSSVLNAATPTLTSTCASAGAGAAAPLDYTPFIDFVTTETWVLEILSALPEDTEVVSSLITIFQSRNLVLRLLHHYNASEVASTCMLQHTHATYTQHTHNIHTPHYSAVGYDI